MLKYIIFLIIGLVVYIPRGYCQEAVYEIDPQSPNSKISFTSSTIFYDVVGFFKDFRGQISLNPANISTSKIKMIVSVGSVDTKNKTRDEHLRSVDFFDVQNFPEAEFQSLSINQQDKDSYKMSGRLTLHGMRKMVEWKVTPIKNYLDAQGKERVVFSAETSVDRKEFGIFWNADSTTYNPLNEKKKEEGFWSKLTNKALKTMGNQFISSDEVKIEVQLEAVKK